MRDREPLAIRGAVVLAITAGIQTAMAFGLPVTVDQFAALSTFVNASSIAAVVLWSRGKVTPAEIGGSDEW